MSNTGIGRSQRWGIEPTSPCLDRRLEHNALSTTLWGPLAGSLQSSTNYMVLHFTFHLRDDRTFECRNGTFISRSPEWSHVQLQVFHLSPSGMVAHFDCRNGTFDCPFMLPLAPEMVAPATAARGFASRLFEPLFSEVAEETTPTLELASAA